jgi:hypothetical protein
MVSRALRWPVLVGGALLCVGAIVSGQADRIDRLARLGAHVDAWERELGSVVADEIYQQTVTRLPRSGVSRESNKPPQENRELVAEFTLIHFDDGVSDWIGVRSVTRVDGKPVAPGPSLNQLMTDASLSWPERWTRMRDRSAAFNIGSIGRDVNTPTFALAVMRTVNQTRFSFDPPRSGTVDGEVLTELGFRERARPTLVSGLGGRNVPLEGTVWLEAQGARVRRTEIRLQDRMRPVDQAAGGEQHARDEDLTSRITVIFAPDANVGTRVPVEMRERYTNSWGDVTTGRATYANYRRFRTSGRIVRPGG